MSLILILLLGFFQDIECKVNHNFIYTNIINIRKDIDIKSNSLNKYIKRSKVLERKINKFRQLHPQITYTKNNIKFRIFNNILIYIIPKVGIGIKLKINHEKLFIKLNGIKKYSNKNIIVTQNENYNCIIQNTKTCFNNKNDNLIYISGKFRYYQSNKNTRFIYRNQLIYQHHKDTYIFKLTDYNIKINPYSILFTIGKYRIKIFISNYIVFLYKKKEFINIKDIYKKNHIIRRILQNISKSLPDKYHLLLNKYFNSNSTLRDIIFNLIKTNIPDIQANIKLYNILSNIKNKEQNNNYIKSGLTTMNKDLIYKLDYLKTKNIYKIEIKISNIFNIINSYINKNISSKLKSKNINIDSLSILIDKYKLRVFLREIYSNPNHIYNIHKAKNIKKKKIYNNIKSYYLLSLP